MGARQLDTGRIPSPRAPVGRVVKEEERRRRQHRWVEEQAFLRRHSSFCSPRHRYSLKYFSLDSLLTSHAQGVPLAFPPPLLCVSPTSLLSSASAFCTCFRLRKRRKLHHEYGEGARELCLHGQARRAGGALRWYVFYSLVLLLVNLLHLIWLGMFVSAEGGSPSCEMRLLPLLPCTKASCCSFPSFLWRRMWLLCTETAFSLPVLRFCRWLGGVCFRMY